MSTVLEKEVKSDSLDNHKSVEEVEKANMDFLASMLDLSEKIDAANAAGASKMRKDLAAQAKYELRYMNEALTILNGDDPNSLKIKEKLGRDASSLHAIKSTLVESRAFANAMNLMKDSISRINAVEDKKQGDSAFNDGGL